MGKVQLLLGVVLVGMGLPALALPGSQLGDVLKGGQTLIQGGKDVLKSSASSVTMLWDDCKKAKKVFENDASVAAMLFTAEGCENTKIQVREGFTDLPLYRKNRAEAIVVKPGCICVGYNHANRSGRSAAFDNVNGSGFLVMSDLEDEQLDKAISAMDCKCGAAARRNSYVQQLSNDAVPKDCGQGCRKKCNLYVGEFNRVDLPNNKKMCAVAFDGHDCKDWKKPIMEGFESFPIYSTYRNDIESVMVRPGCTLTGYDSTNKSGNRVLVDGSRQINNQPLFKNLKGRNELQDKISAVECVCKG